MGACRIDLTTRDRELIARYRLSTTDGVRRFIDEQHDVISLAARGSLDAVELIVDFDVAVEDVVLSPHANDVLRYMRVYDFSVEEIAGIVDVNVETVETWLDGVCTRIARYFEGTEGYSS